MKFTWQLGIAIVFGLFWAGYVINFISSNGNNRPALIFAWTGFLFAMIFYQQHRKQNAKYFQNKEATLEEKEFEAWAKDRNKA
ncbi:MAG: hypothetical protein ABI444_06725 [Candidatus Kapaibacterium sp.]|jgi:hypothetical protein